MVAIHEGEMDILMPRTSMPEQLVRSLCHYGLLILVNFFYTKAQADPDVGM